MARGEAVEGEKGLLLSPIREGSGDSPNKDGTAAECGDRSDVGCIPGEGPTGDHVRSNVHDGQEGMEGSCSREEREVRPPLQTGYGDIRAGVICPSYRHLRM